ncbi:MAG: ABC transporter ATP-binding protein [Clostridiales bacterium]|nr:ABC transporter ATP-binding protein [Clostridiales bacterium]HBM80285.1 hypothetical protein [Clostridiaceae bacterium]
MNSKGKNDNYLLKEFLRRNLLWLALVAILLVMSGFFRMYGAAYIQKITDSISMGIFDGIIALIVFSIVSQFISYATKWLVAVVCMFLREKLALQIRVKMFEHLSKVSFRDYEQHKTGDLQSIIRNDSQKAAEIIYILGSRISTHFFMLLFSVGYMCTVNAPAAIAVIIIAILFGIVNQKILRRIKKYEFAGRKSLGNITSIVINCYENTDIAKAYNAKNYFINFFNKEKNTYNANILNSTKVDTGRLILYNIVNNSSLYGSAIFLGYMSISGKMTIGEVLVFITLLIQVLTPVEVIFRWMANIVSSTAAWDRVYRVLDTKEEELNAGIKTDISISTVKIENISYSYDNEKDIISNFNMDMEVGNSYAIVGESGSGKTTLLKILLGAYRSNTMKIFINGEEIKERDFSGLAAFVPSDTLLFNATIYENIMMGDKSITREECMEWAKKLSIDRWILSLPKGLDTVIQERAGNLSGGQGQIVNILRAVMSNRQIIIMDEPFSSLDKEKERVLINVIDNLKKYKILLITSHRESSIKHIDRVFHVAGGFVPVG